MANLKEVRNRITSVSSTQQITSAMKMVSAAKLRKAQDAIISLRPYADKLQHILRDLCSIADPSQAAYSKQRDIKNVLIIAITSNRGLCGPFNSNVVKLVTKEANEKFKDYKVSVISIGKKADEYFKKSDLHIFGSNLPRRLHRLYDNLTFENVANVATNLMENYLAGDFDRVVLIYNRFKNASVQILTSEQFLPVLPPETDEDSKLATDYIFEPAKEEIVEELIPRSLKIQLYRALLESFASEHGARMTAMHKATDNCTEIIRDLKIKYNKARQAAITNEIIEIVGGAEALKG